MPTDPAPVLPSKARIFWRRLGSSILLWTVVIWALFSGHRLLANYFFLGIIMGLAGLGMMEFYGLIERQGLACFREWGVFGGLLLLLSTFIYLSHPAAGRLPPAKANDFETGFLILFVLGLCLRQFVSPRTTGGFVAIATTLFGLMYVAWLLNFIQKIRFLPADGRFYVLYFVLVTKCSDIGAYAVGTLIGRHKMIPRISPGKTWEGFFGAIAVATAASLAFAQAAGDRLVGMTATHAVILGGLLGGCAVLGDLIESMFKREAGVKDSGRFFPGIGGILDLLDSLLFNAPLMYLYLRHVLT